MAGVRHHSLDALRDEIILGLVVLKITRTGTLAVLERGHGTHSAIDYILAPVGVDLLARTLFRTGEHGAEHHAVGTGGKSLRHVAGKLDAAIGDDRHAGAAKSLGGGIDRSKLRYADAADDARGADGAWADADLDSMGAGLSESDRRLACRDVAGNDVNLREMLDDVLRHVDDALGVAMGGIDHNDVNTGLSELLHAREIALSAGNGCGDAETELIVTVVGRVLVLDETLHISERVETYDAPLLVNERELADLVLSHDLIRLLERSAGLRRDHRLLHHVRKLARLHGGEAHIGRGDHADKTLLIVKHGEAVELKPHALLLGTEEGDVVVRVETYRLGDETIEVALDLGDLLGLLILLKVLVYHAYAARKSHGNRHGCFGHRIHGCRDERYLHLLARSEVRFERCVIGQKIRILRHKRDIIVRKPLERERRHEFIEISVHAPPFFFMHALLKIRTPSLKLNCTLLYHKPFSMKTPLKH